MVKQVFLMTLSLCCLVTVTMSASLVHSKPSSVIGKKGWVENSDNTIDKVSKYNYKDKSRTPTTLTYTDNKDTETTSSVSTPPKPVFPDLCDQNSTQDPYGHSDDCASFTLCSAGVLITLTCPKGSVFHDHSKSCVPEGSEFDTCSKVLQHQQQTCAPGTSHKLVHPKECAQFYQCDLPAGGDHWEEHLQECEYPGLYNPDTARCEHYSMVTCGERREPVDPCDYKVNNCEGHAHCAPCNVRHPSCRGKENGLREWLGREGSPHYVVCAEGRVIYRGFCPQEHGTQIFDPVVGTCVMME